MTLAQIKDAAAAYLHRTTDELTVNSVDIGLDALNQVRMQAELTNDFGFMRKLAQVSVDGVTGGSLDTAVDYDGAPINGQPSVDVKTVVDVGLLDTYSNIIPVEWTTIEDSANRTRADNPYYAVPRYPTDGQALCGPIGQRRFSFSGNKIYYFPRTTGITFTLLLEVYAFTPDWVDADLAPSAELDTPWITKGSQYLQWATVVHLNNMFKDFVFRQEGNLPPPQTLADQGLAALVAWDSFRLDAHRRHTR